jgi:excinuclease ABC subunit A
MMQLRGVRVHNLRQIDLDLPLGKLIVLSGVSGSGKSSLAFDTIFAEGQRRYIESFSASARQYLERIERPNADRIAHVPPAIAIRTDSSARELSSLTTVASVSEIDVALRRLFARIGHVICPECNCEVRPQSVPDVIAAIEQLPAGTRLQLCFAPTEDQQQSPAAWLARGFMRAIIDGQSLSLEQLAAGATLKEAWIVADRLVAGKATPERIADAAELAFREGNGRFAMLVDRDADAAPTLIVDGRAWQVVQYSRHWECTSCHRQFLPPEQRLFEPNFRGGCQAEVHKNRDPSREVANQNCSQCQGTWLCAEALAVRIGQRSIADMLNLTVDQAIQVFAELTQAISAAEQSVSLLARDEIQRRLELVAGLSLGHLKLQRGARSLSGGQVRRLMLAAACGSRITGTLCIVDEPSAGLHPSEVPNVMQTLRLLVQQRNSVIVVDHDPQIIRAADYVVDLGPGAGPQGGRVVFEGTPDLLLQAEDSATAQALRTDLDRPVNPRAPRKPDGWIDLNQIEFRNLKDLRVKIPLGVLCVISGPGGVGKTSLLSGVLVPALQYRLNPTLDAVGRDCCEITGGESITDLSVVDRTPLTRSSRSNAATWIDVFDDIRDVFAMSAEAKQRGFGPQQFSFNAAQGGRCRACRGTGVLRHDMQFLPDVTLTCPECGGTRYRREILDVKYRGRSIADVLAMSAGEAATFFRNHQRLQGRLQMLKQIGLDYLVLGQPTDTLSGGEAQRLKLAARLTAGRGSTLIVCDEATVGLHPADVTRLANCFDELLGIGHSIVVIDNSPELLNVADYVIELGLDPKNGEARIAFEGPRTDSRKKKSVKPKRSS